LPIEQNVARKQPVLLDGLLAGGHANELRPNELAARIDIVHPKLDHTVWIALAAGESAGFGISFLLTSSRQKTG